MRILRRPVLRERLPGQEADRPTNPPVQQPVNSRRGAERSKYTFEPKAAMSRLLHEFAPTSEARTDHN